MKNFNIFGVHGKIGFLGEGIYEKQIYRGELPRGGLDSLHIYAGGLGKEGGGVFEGRWLIPQCTLWLCLRPTFSAKIFLIFPSFLRSQVLSRSATRTQSLLY